MNRKKQYIPENIKQKVYCFIHQHIRMLKLSNIAEVIIRLIILYIDQIDIFGYSNMGLGPFSTFGYVIHNNFQTVMRDDNDMNSFKDIYGEKLIKFQNIGANIIHVWHIQINNIPIRSYNQQMMLGICAKHDVGEKRNRYYGINDRFNHVYEGDNKIITKYLNIDIFQEKCMMKYDIITIEITKCHNIINLNFYVNGIRCTTFYNIDESVYQLFVSTNVLFVSFSLKHYECKVLIE